MAADKYFRLRILSIALTFSALLGYLEWGGGNSTFLFAAEIKVVVSLLAGSKEVFHPFTILLMLGQLLLLLNAYLPRPRLLLLWLGMG